VSETTDTAIEPVQESEDLSEPSTSNTAIRPSVRSTSERTSLISDSMPIAASSGGSSSISSSRSSSRSNGRSAGNVVDDEVKSRFKNAAKESPWWLHVFHFIPGVGSIIALIEMGVKAWSNRGRNTHASVN